MVTERRVFPSCNFVSLLPVLWGAITISLSPSCRIADRRTPRKYNLSCHYWGGGRKAFGPSTFGRIWAFRRTWDGDGSKTSRLSGKHWWGGLSNPGKVGSILQIPCSLRNLLKQSLPKPVGWAYGSQEWLFEELTGIQTQPLLLTVPSRLAELSSLTWPIFAFFRMKCFGSDAVRVLLSLAHSRHVILKVVCFFIF